MLMFDVDAWGLGPKASVYYLDSSLATPPSSLLSFLMLSYIGQMLSCLLINTALALERNSIVELAILEREWSQDSKLFLVL